MTLTPQQLMGQKEWNETIRTNIENAIGSKLDGGFIAANYPAGFNYAVKQQYYNADSLSALDCLVTETDGIPSLSDSYSTLYKRVMDSLEYSISDSDKARMNEEETAHGALVGKIINIYKETGLDEIPKSYPDIMYIMKRIKEVTGTSYLDVDFREYPNLSELCRNLSEYARLGVFTAKMQNIWSSAYDRMNAILKNINNPTEENGGLLTSVGTYTIGWDKLPETERLRADLKQGNSVTLSLSTDNFSQSSSDLHFDSSVSVRLPFSWFFDLTVNNKTSYDLSNYAQHESSLKITIKFNGITTFGAVPTPLAANNKKGWFAGDILKDAAVKSGQDTTGYQLHGSEFNPKTLFGKNGQLKRLKTFVISQQPEISLHFSKFDCSSIKDIFTSSTGVSFSILGGLIRGNANNNYSFSNYNYDSQAQTLDVSIIPAPIGDSGSIGKQTAYVLGGVAETYGD